MYVRRRRVAVCTSKAPLKNSVDTYTASAKRKDAARCLQGVGACGRISPARGGKLRLRTSSIKKATPDRVLLFWSLWPDFPREGDKLRLRTSSIKKQHPFGCCFFGACGRIRTGDLLITSELLCQLSHTSINADGSIAHFAGAVNRFSGEESLFLLRLLPKWVRTGNDNT